MAELGIIASVVSIADTGLRLSIKLYTFGEIVSTADKSVISISKDVSLTSSVLKELGSLLENDAQSHIFSKNAVQTADTVVKECLEVFQEMESILVKKLPSLSGQDGIRGGGGGKKSKATALLERMKWGYLQPKLQLLRSNLDRLKSTLLLMLNVITYARQVAGKSEPPSVIEDQRSLIEDLAKSNQDYIRKFEQMKIGIQNTPETPPKDVQRDWTGGVIELEREPNTQNHGHSKSKSKSMSPERATTASANINNMYINANVQSLSIPRGFEKTKQSRKKQKVGSEEDTLFSHLKHYLSLVNSLLDEVDEIKYEIRVDSRDRVRTDICEAYQREMKHLDTSHKSTRMVLAEQQLAPLVAGVKRRLEQVDGPNPGGQEKKLSTGIVTDGPHQPQSELSTMQFSLEGVEDSYSMPFNDGLGNPFMPTDWDHKQSLKTTDGGDSNLAEPLFGRSFKARENVAPATDAITIVDQHDEERKNSIPAEDQDTGIRLPVEATQQRTNPNRQFQGNHSLPVQHQQGQTQLSKANPNATATAGSKSLAHQSSNGSSRTSAHHLSHYGDLNTAKPRQSARHPTMRSAQQQVQIDSAYPSYLPLPSIGVSQQMAQIARPNTQQQQAQQHHAAQQMALPNTQQQQAQLHHAAQQYAAARQQQRQPQQQHQQAQRQQQHANASGHYQMHQAQGNDQAKDSLSQAQSVRTASQPSLSLYQYAAPLPPKTEEPPQKKRGRPSREEDELRMYGASASVTTLGSRPRARALLEQVRDTADGSGNLSGSKAQNNERGTSPTYDDLMQEVEAAVVGTLGSATSPEHRSVAARLVRQHQNSDTYIDSSDAQAKVLAAQQIAIEKDVNQRIRVRSRMTRRLQQAPRSQVHSGERDTRGELLVDDGAGFAGHVHKRSREDLPPGGYEYPDEVDEVKRPSTATMSSQRSDTVGVITNIRCGLSEGDINTFPSARVDMTDTGGLVEVDAQSQRLCLESTGNEATLIQSPPIASETDANQARRPISQQHQRHLRAGTVNDHDPLRTPLPKSNLHISNTSRKPFVEKERNIKPMSGHEMDEDGEVRSDFESLGRVTSGHRPILVGAEVDDNGYVVDNEGNKVGDSTLMESRKGYEGPTEEGTVAADDANIAKEIKPKKAKHMHAMRRPRGPGGRFLAAEEVSLNEESERKEAQVPYTVRPQMSSIEGLKPSVTQRRGYSNTLPEALLQQSHHLAPLGSFSTNNQVSPPDNGMFQYNNAADSWWDNSELANMEQAAANPAGSRIKRPSKPSLKRDLVALNAKFIMRVKNTVAARKSRARASEKGPDGESEKPGDNENAVSGAIYSAHDEKDSMEVNPSSLGWLTGETSQVPRGEEVSSNDKGQADDLGSPKSASNIMQLSYSSSFIPPSFELNPNALQPLERSETRTIQKRRLRSSPIPNRDYDIEIDNPSRSPASEPTKGSQESPAALQCTLCPKRFTRANDVRSHMRTHNDECPFFCSVCQKGFTRQHDRNQHERSHNEPAAQKGSANEVRSDRASRSQYPDASALGVMEYYSAGPPEALELAQAPPIVQEAITHNRHINQGLERELKRHWQAQTPPLPFALGLNENGVEDEVPRNEGANLALDDINTDLDHDLDLGLDNSPTIPYPSMVSDEDEDEYSCIVPVAGKAGNVVDDLVTLWTLLPVG